MEEFVRGDIVIVPFPFSNLSAIKKRPALVLFALPGDDIVLCQITSRDKGDRLAVELRSSDFVRGGLERTSYVRPSRIFTAEKSIIQYRAGNIKPEKLSQVRDVIINLLNGSL